MTQEVRTWLRADNASAGHHYGKEDINHNVKPVPQENNAGQ
jgi:hypothetical protein